MLLSESCSVWRTPSRLSGDPRVAVDLGIAPDEGATIEPLHGAEQRLGRDGGLAASPALTGVALARDGDVAFCVA